MKKRMRKRALALLLALTLFVSEFNMSAITAYAAADHEPVAETVAEGMETGSTESTVTEEVTTEAVADEGGTTATEKETTEDVASTEAKTTEAVTEESITEAVTTEEPADKTTENETTAEVAVVEEPEEDIEPDSYNASSYKTTKHLLSSGANDTNDDGQAIYSNIKDSSVTVASIQARGGRYAKCKAEEKKKGKVEKDPYYKLTFENSIGDFTTTGFTDNKGKHHGNAHFVEQCYKQYQVYSQVYSYMVTDDNAKTIDYYYFIYVWWEELDKEYHKASENDIMTYCIEYGASIKKDDPAYTQQKKKYDSLSDNVKNKIALAIYYGPHRDDAGNYYSTKNTKAGSGIKGYDPSTWTKTFWKRYLATQLYIWSVQAGSFSAGDAEATAEKLDCLDFYKMTVDYVKTATTLPDGADEDKDTAKKNAKKIAQDSKGIYTEKFKSRTDGVWSCDDPDIRLVTSEDGKEITVISAKAIDKDNPVILTFTKEPVPKKDLGAVWYASGKAQDMCDSVISAEPCMGYMAVYTPSPGTASISLHKASAANPDKPVEGAQFLILSESQRGAVYNPETNAAMVDVDAKNFIVGIKTWDDQKVYKYTEARYEQLKAATGNRCSLLYDIAFYGGLVIETDENGDADSGELLKSYVNAKGETVNCNYSIIEISTPYPYMLPYEVKPLGDANGFITTVFRTVVFSEDTSYVWLDVDNEEIPGRLVIFKYDEETKEPLANVVFHIYRDASCTDFYTQVVTNADGEAVLGEIPVGTYYIREVSGQDIYEIYGGIDVIEIQSDEWTEKDMSNRPWIVNISVEKQLDESSIPTGQDGGKYSLAGAEFGLYAGTNISGANGKILYEKDALITTLVTGEDGKASVDAAWARKNLRLGTYYMKELTAPEGFVLNDAVFEIDATDPQDTGIATEDDNIDEYTVDTVLHRNVVVKEKLNTSPIKIIKKKQMKHSVLAGVAEGAVFSVYDLDAMEAAKITVSDVAKFAFALPEYDQYRVVINANPDTKYTVTTDAEGRAETTALMDGNYAVVEVKAPEGYVLAESQAVKLPDEAGKEIVLEFYDRLLLGRIEVIKLGDSISGYEAIETKYGTWNRLTYEKKPLAGVEFTIYDEIGAAAVITTNGVGYAQSEELPAGKYRVKETKTPAGLILDDTVYEVEIKAGDTQIINPKLEITNDVMTAELAVYKVGERILPSVDDSFGFGKKPLEDVVFGVYNSEALADNQGNIILPAGSCVGIAKTDAEGQALLKECLVPGDYYYQEIRALEGYVLDTEQHPFTLRLGTNAAVERMELNKESPLLNQFYKARIELVKVDRDNGDIKLAGAVFGLYNADTREQYGEYTTDADGRISIEEMPYGRWYFKELEAPAGYVLEYAVFEFEVTEEDAGSVIQITATNRSTPKLGFSDYINPVIPIALCILGLSLITVGIYFGLRNKKRK